jgi:hypothetical protein
MSQLDDLLHRSKAPGRFESRRRFSLSRDKAIEKLREFSLRDPRQYILELVQAAVYAGATYIAVDVDSERLLLAWVGGRPLAETELEHVFDFLFADRGRREQRHLVQLAVGLNALLQRKPKILRLESGDGTLEGTTRMDLDKKGRGELGRPSDPLAGTYLLAEFGTNWLSRFSGDTFTREAGLIEERCRYTPVPVLLNGSAPFGWKASRQIRAHTDQAHASFDDGDRRGLVAVPAGGRSRGFSLVVAGVEVTRALVPELGQLPAPAGGMEPIALTGVICDDDLRKTADQSDIVRDGRFASMLHAVQPHATTLLRRVVGKGYQPPPLPRIATEARAAADATPAEPISDPIPQLSPRPPISIAGLQALPAGTPVFRVREDDASAVAAAADPARFPHPVLILRDAQAPSLDEAAPDLAVHRLTAPADVDFVRRALERRARTRTARVSVDLGRGHKGTLHLTLTLGGPTAAWADPADGALAVRLAHGDRTTWCGHMDLHLPGVRVAMELERLDEENPEAVATAAAVRARAEAWRLLPEGPPRPEDADAVLSLARGLIGTHLHPHFVDGEDGSQLAPALPAAWGEAADRLLDLPILPTTEGDRSVRELAAIQGTGAVWTLKDGAPSESIDAIEERLGRGHLSRPGQSPVLCSVVRMPHGWEWWPGRDWTLPGVHAVLALTPTVQAQAAPDGWTLGPPPLPGTTLLLRGGAPADLDDGVDTLVRQLRRAQATDAWAELAGAAHEEIARAMGRLALLDAESKAGSLDAAAVLRPSDGSSWVTPRELRAHPDGAVAPRHGPRVAEPRTALVTFDELKVLGPLSPRLRFDDAPAVWRSLVADTPDAWLIRHPVRVPGLEGWLGLRFPFDATSGVLVQGTGAVIAISSMDRRLPCHGLLWLSGGHAAPTRQQLELLRLARQQLYQELAGKLASGSADPRQADAHRYAARFARVAVADAGGRLMGTAAEIARRVKVAWPDGRDFGSLAMWFAAPPETRPALPEIAGVRATPPDAILLEAPQITAQIASRLTSALGWPSGGVECDAEAAGGDRVARIDGRWSVVEGLKLVVDIDHPLVERARSGDRDALEATLLACALRIARWAAPRDAGIDLLSLQQVLVAQRLTGSATT